jgi:hypothetical protein
MIWNDECNQYLTALEIAKQKLPQKEREIWDYWGWGGWIAEPFTSNYIHNLLNSRPEMIPDFSAAPDEIQWFVDALNDEQRKWFALGISSQAKALPDVFFLALVQAAVHETNPSLNGCFVGVACRFGPDRVTERLLGYAEHGTGLEQQLALHAFYWVLWYIDWKSQEPFKVLAVLEAAATNLQYSSSVREHAQNYCTEVNLRIRRDKT